ncbi:hypothetical protein IGI04_027843 [Brassica rapa subsp. trilocularis]|uniref:Protein kinase domain-containing protein n=1 Tax=Brassica rapa subsp. trilocularis TaxID=1813537 RepID=A0ABQ7L0W7_BRACM|nr:hypothetical protein IGI04_027248 [Brassica rapa subsp. trilocularis]KAG5380001.1 hypothetical protein IGI04_027843 [Brassica rapa subsp. trilocularis]
MGFLLSRFLPGFDKKRDGTVGSSDDETSSCNASRRLLYIDFQASYRFPRYFYPLPFSILQSCDTLLMKTFSDTFLGPARLSVLESRKAVLVFHCAFHVHKFGNSSPPFRASILHSLNHPNVLSFYALYEMCAYMRLVLEYCFRVISIHFCSRGRQLRGEDAEHLKEE